MGVSLDQGHAPREHCPLPEHASSTTPISRQSHRIAVALHEPQIGGATQALLRVLPLLTARGWRFSFWVPGLGEAERELAALGHEVAAVERLLRFSTRGLMESPGALRRLASGPEYVRRWRAWLSSRAPALLHANTLLSLPEVLTRPRSGPPVLLHVHEVLPPGAKGAAAAVMARRADVVVAVSEASARALCRRGVFATVIRNGVPAAGPRRRVTAGGELVVGTLGTLSKRKGSELFVAAADRIRRQRDGIEFRLVGDLVVGAERSWAESLLASARRSGVRHRSGVDPFEELAEWDIFVLPSRVDPFPLAVLEAMSVGLPVVATRVDGIPEQVGDDAGLLVEPENVDALADAVLKLADSPVLRAALGAAGRRRVERLFTLERQADELDRVYRAAVARRA
jgi:glycosyltransferase involved in cell wall biosynthesis